MDSAITLALHDLSVAQPWLGSLAVLLADDGVFLLPMALIAVWFTAGREDGLPRRHAILAGVVAAVLAIGLGMVLERILKSRWAT